MRTKASFGVRLLTEAGLLLALLVMPVRGGIIYTPVQIPLGVEPVFISFFGGESGVYFQNPPSLGCSMGACSTAFTVSGWEELRTQFAASTVDPSYARALEAGEPIGPDLPGGQWSPFSGAVFADTWIVGGDHFEEEWGAAGEWVNVTDRYLGFRVIHNIDDELGNTLESQTLYGWARLTVWLGTPSFEPLQQYPIHATFTGYALNLVPDQPILAGQTGVPEPSTWGLLVLGLGVFAAGCCLRVRAGRASRCPKNLLTAGLTGDRIRP